jgi:phosphate starvation-inducible PhoH-like protein
LNIPDPHPTEQRSAVVSREILLEPADNERLANLCGQFDEHLRQIEKRLGVEINNRAGRFVVVGTEPAVTAGVEVLERLWKRAAEEQLSPSRVNLHLQDAGVDSLVEVGREADEAADVLIRTPRITIRGRGPNQRRYLKSIQEHDVNFGIGPAGTGKTYLAVASAVEALKSEQVQRLVLTRPAVEAGERLGFLPGDMAQKVDPYLRPLYDALFEMIGFEQVPRLIERNVIEVAPLAFMRGRSLNDAFVILDEAQNTTLEQMKMFLTRIGFGSTAVINGDVTQVDLPKGQRSGLRHAVEVLAGIQGVSFTFFNARDVVRHPMVQRIIQAYEAHEGDR